MPTTDSTSDVLLLREGALGRIVLNRPHAINALTEPMVTAVSEALREWASDETVQTVSIEGAGERGLSAGGDVVAVRRARLAGEDHTSFFRAEYAMNAALASFTKPVVAFQDGVVMGGGIGISSYASLRLVTERSRIAMPETGIGFFPDVGALYLLSRAPGEIGTHLALTGTTIGAADAVAAELSDTAVSSADWPDVLARLADGVPALRTTVPPSPSTLAGGRGWIDECYAGDEAVAIVARLLSHASPDAQAAGALIETRSPLSVAVTLEALRRATTMETVAEVLEQDLVLADRLVAGGDFVEGVRAQLVDKDRSPRWQHDSLGAVPRELVESYLANGAG
ncbi:3-hydroxyisobutyryl-CoA hydrolase [Luteipulveratus mongoliensis]|uniref:3-hydroxyisobutyryl-CoA hydrolase n=1 Tax=Luteipulveratus mongoliensis TaxID=571913 RepID=A0A0K1JD44_9MICO|nr:3-hydroxyisobutyryl-CoA hydrolase [Luteipulveratus mongoliensis]AKU14626.1 3-hydroxyisobutyryl-CoA hydrolase [Luteipulveratus mongoliensis]AKU18483.1 3-hydroxyisobutyryl-CoA hydrolase [Luteipulveratus mongoliensis]